MHNLEFKKTFLKSKEDLKVHIDKVHHLSDRENKLRILRKSLPKLLFFKERE